MCLGVFIELFSVWSAYIQTKNALMFHNFRVKLGYFLKILHNLPVLVSCAEQKKNVLRLIKKS